MCVCVCERVSALNATHAHSGASHLCTCAPLKCKSAFVRLWGVFGNYSVASPSHLHSPVRWHENYTPRRATMVTRSLLVQEPRRCNCFAAATHWKSIFNQFHCARARSRRMLSSIIIIEQWAHTKQYLKIEMENLSTFFKLFLLISNRRTVWWLQIRRLRTLSLFLFLSLSPREIPEFTQNPFGIRNLKNKCVFAPNPSIYPFNTNRLEYGLVAPTADHLTAFFFLHFSTRNQLWRHRRLSALFLCTPNAIHISFAWSSSVRRWRPDNNFHRFFSNCKLSHYDMSTRARAPIK